MKVTPCLIGFTLLFSSIFMMIQKGDKSIYVKFYSLLDENQKKIYEKIMKERMMIYISGMALGLGLGIYYYINSKRDNYKLCKSLMIIYLVKFGFYYFYPKSPLMLYSLTTKQQTDAWATIYIEMKERWKRSIVIGFIGYLLIGFYF